MGMRLGVGSRGNHGSLPGTAHSAFLAYRKNCTKTGVAGLFILLNCWGQGKEEADTTRRRQIHAQRLKARVGSAPLRRVGQRWLSSSQWPKSTPQPRDKMPDNLVFCWDLRKQGGGWVKL